MTASAVPTGQSLDDLERLILEGYDRPDVVEVGMGIEDPRRRGAYYHTMIDQMREVKEAEQREYTPPVSARTFLEDGFFLRDQINLWPRLKEEIIEACSGKYIEAVFTGSIGTGKTTAALIVQAYFLYRVMNLRDPHHVFDMDRNSEIAFVMQSLKGKTAYTVDYMRFRRMIEGCPWFRTHAPHDRDRTSVIAFKNSPVEVQPLSGKETAAIGENVMGGVIDEVNHMQVIQSSARMADGGVFDQMRENYRAVSRRRESRFQRMGQVPGMLCLVGSANYAGQFTDQKLEERDQQLARTGKTNIYIFDKRAWEVQPDDRFPAERFRVFLGDGSRKPRVIPDHEATHPLDTPRIMEVPVNYRNAFEADLSGAIKDIAGIALGAYSTFIGNAERVTQAFSDRINLFATDWADFERQNVHIRKLKPISNPDCPRFIHVDLALTMDNAAFAIGYCPGFAVVDRGGGMRDTLPKVVIEGALSVQPPAGGGQIPIHKLKKLVFTLREMGYPIEWVSLDGFQSADFIQTMKRSKLRSGLISMDKTPHPYMLAKQLILDGLLEGPDHPLAREEFSTLIWVAQKGKVDHTPDGSKDLSDAITGVAWGLASQRATWIRYGVDPRNSSVMVRSKDE